METTEKLEQTIAPDGDGDTPSRRPRPIVIGGELLAVAGGIVAARRLRARRTAQRRRRGERLHVRFR